VLGLGVEVAEASIMVALGGMAVCLDIFAEWAEVVGGVNWLCDAILRASKECKWHRAVGCDIGANVGDVARWESRIGKFEDDVRARAPP
jgi:hypothetical protein